MEVHRNVLDIAGLTRHDYGALKSLSRRLRLRP
jgi:hypothetical protein